MKTRPSAISALLMSLVLLAAVVPGGRSMTAQSPQTAHIASTPLAQANSQPVQVFRDDFNGTSLNPSVWRVFDNGGTIDVSSGLVSLSSPGGTFPYIHSQINPIPPTGDFAITIGVQYATVGNYGTNFAVTNQVPANNIPDAAVPPSTFGVHQDSNGYIIVDHAHGIVYSTPAPNLAFHVVEFRWLDTTNEYYLDGQLVKTVTRDVTVPRPSLIWFGNPVNPLGGDAWTSLKLDYIEVEALSSSGCIQPPDGLVSWWPGDSNALDFTGGNHGVLQGGASFTTGKVGQAFALDGLNDYVFIGHPATLNITTDLTLAAWVNPSTLPPDNFVHLYAIVAKIGGSIPVDDYVFWLGNTSGAVSLYGAIGDGSTTDYGIQGGNVSVGAWNHVAMTYDHTTGVNRLYINGVQVAERVRNDGIHVSGSDVLIGSQTAPYPRYFHGGIDEVQIYNHALSANQVQAIASAGSAGLCKTFSVFGRVTKADATPLAGVSIAASSGDSTTTDATGHYTFTNLISGTSTLTPTLNGYTFLPTIRTITGPPDATGQDFIGTPIPAPVADFDASPLTGNAPLPVSMHNISTGNYTSCTWDYGDGQTGSLCDGYHNHIYVAAGNYTVKLTVSGPGGTDIETKANYITVSAPPSLQLTITELSDAFGQVYPVTNILDGTVDGNNITALVKIEYPGGGLPPGTLSIADGLHDTILGGPQPVTSKEMKIKFSSTGLAWNEANLTPFRSVYARFKPNTGTTVVSTQVFFSVHPRPVVLVHGWNDTATSWNTYRDMFLKPIGVTSYPIDMDTGDGDGITASIKENAGKLRDDIKAIKIKAHAELVDVVAHSMGGLITRYYIANYMAPDTPDVHQLIMLGTPNAGSVSAEVNALGKYVGNPVGVDTGHPSSSELTRWSVFWFNVANQERRNVPFYAIAGNYFCLVEWPPANPIEPNPDDIAVWVESVFAIPLEGAWVFPGRLVPGCSGDHRGMRDNASNHGGQEIFDRYVKPLLQGTIPAQAQGLTDNVHQTPAGVSQTAIDGLSAVQFTDVQTGKLQAGGRLEFSQMAEPASNNTFSFIVVGAPDQMTVSIRDPNGRTITPNTSDPQIQYMQMDKDFLAITSYTISSPVVGAWTTIVEANAQTPASGIGVAALGTLVSEVRLTVPVPLNASPQVHHALAVTAQLRANNNPMPEASVSGLLIHPDGTTTTITLLDDGQHADGTASDGIFGYQFTPRTPGLYNAVINASGTNNNSLFRRSTIWVAQVDGAPVFLPFIRR